ncbi:MAG: ATP-binding protein [Bacteroidia bacterium]|nr:ATP-binding protein [Bacteroidia bacterium]MCO5253983.1 ATP-binding protein [Bacteroidota bacterium]
MDYFCDVINRIAKKKILEMAKKFPIIVLTGPRQSGKTTISKQSFPDYRYVSLENPDDLNFALSDPKGFLSFYDKKVIIDEAQNVPELFSYLQQIVDTSNHTGQYILTGSQNYLMMEKISQSLAGRVYLMNLLPLSFDELKSEKNFDLDSVIFEGGYPRIYDKKIAPQDFFPSYIQTYVERDVRTILNVQDISTFQKFIQLCAVHAGQLFNASAISNALGLSVKTVQNWISILETSFIVFQLKPWHNNFSKRVVKTPKLYFYDSGLLSHLLGKENKEDWIVSSHKGVLFENTIITNILKDHYNQGASRNFYFWRDSNGNEIDLIIEKGKNVQCIELKSSQTVKPEYLKSLHYLDKIAPQFDLEHYLINTQDQTQKRSNETILSWKDTDLLIM